MKMRFLFLIMISLFLVSVKAETYKVLSIYKASSIQVGDSIVKVGDKFEGDFPIRWTDSATAIKVERMADKKIVVMSKKQFENNMCSSIGDYMKQTHHLSTRGSSELEIVEDNLDGVLPFGKGITFDFPLSPNSSRWFAIRWYESGVSKVVKLKTKKKGTQLILDKATFGKDKPSKAFQAELIIGTEDDIEKGDVVENSIMVIPFD